MTRTVAPAAVPDSVEDTLPRTLTPADLGVGARVTLAVMADDYGHTILDAVAARTPRSRGSSGRPIRSAASSADRSRTSPTTCVRCWSPRSATVPT